MLVTAGIAVFQWKAEKSGKPGQESNLFGICLLLLSLLLDGLTGPRQKAILSETKCSGTQMMLTCNVYALLLVLVGLFSSYGEGLEGLKFIMAPNNQGTVSLVNIHSYFTFSHMTCTSFPTSIHYLINPQQHRSVEVCCALLNLQRARELCSVLHFDNAGAPEAHPV